VIQTVMNIYRIISLTNLIATPLAPAMIYASDVYRVLLDLKYNPYFAGVIASFAIIGIEGTGALTFHNATGAWREKSWSKMLLSILFGVIYTVIMIVGIQIINVRNSTIALLVLLTVGAYIGSAIYHSSEESKAEEQTDVDNKLELLKAKRLLTNAETRNLKVQTERPTVQLDKTEQSMNTQRRITPKAKQIKVVLDEHPDWSKRQIADDVGCSPTTASYWVDYWMQE